MPSPASCWLIPKEEAFVPYEDEGLDLRGTTPLGVAPTNRPSVRLWQTWQRQRNCPLVPAPRACWGTTAQAPFNGGNPSNSSFAAPGWDAVEPVRQALQPWACSLGAVVRGGPFMA